MTLTFISKFKNPLIARARLTWFTLVMKTLHNADHFLVGMNNCKFWIVFVSIYDILRQNKHRHVKRKRCFCTVPRSLSIWTAGRTPFINYHFLLETTHSRKCYKRSQEHGRPREITRRQNRKHVILIDVTVFSLPLILLQMRLFVITDRSTLRIVWNHLKKYNMSA